MLLPHGFVVATGADTDAGRGRKSSSGSAWLSYMSVERSRSGESLTSDTWFERRKEEARG